MDIEEVDVDVVAALTSGINECHTGLEMKLRGIRKGWCWQHGYRLLVLRNPESRPGALDPQS
jgi:hypothetical protein